MIKSSDGWLSVSDGEVLMVARKNNPYPFLTSLVKFNLTMANVLASIKYYWNKGANMNILWLDSDDEDNSRRFDGMSDDIIAHHRSA